MKQYRAGVIGCGRMGGFIDNEWAGGPLEDLLPHSHAGVYEVVDRIDLVACCDPRADVMAVFGERYGVPKEKQYTDYEEMIRKERLDIVSVATQPHQRAEIVEFACEQGVPALYCEKALAASLEEADRIVEAVKRHNVAFNMGTHRRWDPGFESVKRMIDSGEMGALKNMVIYSTGALYNSASHMFDLMLWLNNDVPVESVQAHLPNGERDVDGGVLLKDPVGEGTITFANGVVVYALNTPRSVEFEVICERGTVTSENNSLRWSMRRVPQNSKIPWDLQPVTFPKYQRQSINRLLVEDLVHSLDTGEPTRGGVEAARANQELIAAFVESYRRGGARVELPLDVRNVHLGTVVSGRKPRYTRDAVS